jgi:hypothetical protein
VTRQRRLMQRGRRRSAAVAEQTEYAREKLAHGQAVLDLQRAGHDHGRGHIYKILSSGCLIGVDGCPYWVSMKLEVWPKFG